MRSAALISVCSLAIAASAQAQRALTLDETLALAQRNNRDLQAAREALGQVEAVVEQVRAQLLPTVALQGRYTYNYPSAALDPKTFTAATDGLAGLLQGTTSDPLQAAALQAFRDQLAIQAGQPITIVKEHQLDFSASAQVPLVVPGAYPAYKSARRQRLAAAANVEVSEAQLLLGAATGFYAAAGTDELLTARRHAVEVAAETVRNAKARLQAGVVNRVEVTRAELAYNRAAQQLEESEDARAQAYRALATLIQLRDPFVVRPAERTFVDRPLTELQRDAPALRPEVRAYDLNVDAQGAAAFSGWLRWLPTLSAFGRFAAGNYQSFSGKQYSIATGLQLDWVLYDGGLRDATRHAAAAQQRALELQRAQLRDNINDDIVKADQERATKRNALKTAEKAVALSQETLGLVRAQHDAGTATQLDLLQAQDSLATAEAAVAQARFDLVLGELQLARAAGTFPPRGSAR